MTTRQERAQSMSVVYAVLGGLTVVVGLQLILFVAAIDAFQGGHQRLLVFSTLASGLCFVAACWLVRHFDEGPISGNERGLNR